MIRYFFIIFGLLALLMVAFLGLRGASFTSRPFQLFPDMDDQDKIKAQRTSTFFSDGKGSRAPVFGAVAGGLESERQGDLKRGGTPHSGWHDFEFSEGKSGYYFTGSIDDHFANGMPKELNLSKESAQVFLRRGQERFAAFCTPCHGLSGDGQGIASKFGVPSPANLLSAPYRQKEYPDGHAFWTITHGKGNMGELGPRIPVSDRWAIVAYLRALQLSQNQN